MDIRSLLISISLLAPAMANALAYSCQDVFKQSFQMRSMERLEKNPKLYNIAYLYNVEDSLIYNRVPTQEAHQFKNEVENIWMGRDPAMHELMVVFYENDVPKIQKFREFSCRVNECQIIGTFTPRSQMTAKIRDLTANWMSRVSEFISKIRKSCQSGAACTKLSEEELTQLVRGETPMEERNAEEIENLKPFVLSHFEHSRQALGLHGLRAVYFDNMFYDIPLGGPPTAEWILDIGQTGFYLRFPVDKFSLTEPYKIMGGRFYNVVTLEQRSILMTEVLNYYARTSFDMKVREQAALYARLNEALRSVGYAVNSGGSFGGVEFISLDESNKDITSHITSHARGPFHADRNWMTQWSKVPAPVRDVLLKTMPETWFTVSAANRITRILNAKPKTKQEKIKLYSFVQDWALLPEGMKKRAGDRLTPTQQKQWASIVKKYGSRDDLPE